ncbi:MAG: hypothetical protein ACRD4Y_06300, partial [Candidatus Acidiferrales bacterium]
PDGEPGSRTVGSILREIARHPARYLFTRWNWKSAVMSSLIRASIFFFTNLSAGWHAAIGAMLAELALRSLTSGFYGAITEALASARPVWAAITAAMVLLPLLAHSLELLVHWLRHTPNLVLSILSSLAFTAISTAFNFYAMRRGALLVGYGSRPIGEDLILIPGLILDFLLAGPRWILSKFQHRKRAGE